MVNVTRAQLEDLFVEPEYRNKGLGKAFFGELGRVAEDNVSSDTL